MKIRPHFNFFKDSTHLYIMPSVLYFPKLNKFGDVVIQLRWLKWGVSIWI